MRFTYKTTTLGIFLAPWAKRAPTYSSVPAGPYDVTVSAPGFRQEVRSGITMTVGATLRLDFKLAVGDVQQKVVVTSEAPQVDTTTSTLSGLVSDTSIRQLPLNG